MARPIIDEVVKAEVQRKQLEFGNLDFQQYTGKVETAPVKIVMYDGGYKGDSLIGHIKSVYNNWQLERGESYWLEMGGRKFFMPQQLLRLLKTLAYCQMHTNSAVSAGVAMVFIHVMQSYVTKGHIVIPDISTLSYTSKTQEFIVAELFDWIAMICEGNNIEIDRPVVATVKSKEVSSRAAITQKKEKSSTSRKRDKSSAAAALSKEV